MNNIRKQNSIVKKLNRLQRGRNGIIEWEGIVLNISSAYAQVSAIHKPKSFKLLNQVKTEAP